MDELHDRMCLVAQGRASPEIFVSSLVEFGEVKARLQDAEELGACEIH